MRFVIRIMLFWAAAVLVSFAPSLAWPGSQETGKPRVAVDPQTGRAVGAKEMQPDELKKLIEQKAKLIVIDVRDDAEFQKETIKGAIHIPLENLEARLKEIPKDTVLVFT